MRNMSFMLTTWQVRARIKRVTRRLGWWFLKSGDLVMSCEQCQGLKKGEKIVRIDPIRIVNTRPEPLDHITAGDVILEGFISMTPAEFVEMFCEYNHCKPDAKVNRIEFEYLEGVTP